MLRSMKDLQDCTIGATDGAIGKVKDFYFDDDDWAVRYLVVETGSWLQSRKVLISPISLLKPDWPARTLPVSITQAQVRHSPDIDTDKPVSRQHEQDYLGYYGYPAYWGGTGLWGEGVVPYGLVPYNLVPESVGFGANRAEQERDAEAFASAKRARHRQDDPHLRSCQAVMGYHLHATDGEIGHVEGMLVDELTWAIRYLIVNTSNWWLGHQVLVAPQWVTAVHWAEESVLVDLTRLSIQEAPPFDSTAELNRLTEMGLYKHHGRAGYWGGGGGAAGGAGAAEGAGAVPLPAKD